MPPLPEDLMNRLHEANEHLQQARKKLDGADMFGTEESQEAAKALRAAEQEIEDVTRQIDGMLPKDAPSAAAQ
jgi:hypothetical protein